MDYAKTARKVASRFPSFTTDEVLDVTDFIQTLIPELSTHEGRMAFARRSPSIMALVNSGLRIGAIKELRTLSAEFTETGQCLGLHDAKSAIDEIGGFSGVPRPGDL